jgi:hypothetical protein
MKQLTFMRHLAGDSALMNIAVVLAAIAAAMMLAFPLHRARTDVSINYNEGFNAYRAAFVETGQPLYGSAPRFIVTNYPPLSFHLISWISAPNRFISAGRWVAFASLLMSGVTIGLIIRTCGGSRAVAIFNSLVWLIAIALLREDRIAVNDPQMLADAIALGGIYAYAGHGASPSGLRISAILFCLAGFTKHHLVALPLSIAVDLLRQSRKGFTTFAVAAAVAAACLFAATVAVDGRQFLSHLLVPRAYWLVDGWATMVLYVTMVFPVLVVASIWALSARSSPLWLVFAFFSSHVLAFLMAGGDGVEGNIFFNALAVAIIICGLAAMQVHVFAERDRPAMRRSATVAVVWTMLLGLGIHIPPYLRAARSGMANLPRTEVEFHAAVDFVGATRGPALCETLAVCYRAGKPLEYDAYFVNDQMLIGRLTRDEVIQLFEKRHFRVIQLVRAAGDSADGHQLSLTRGRFSEAVVTAILQHYRVAKTTSEAVLLVPM